ncbi:uncharacterized protein LOC115756813 isoform X1 [Rhodamnia argentea]|uniref:Uncharacterized protein LOC115756813 isoform X1 n=1 Tax=Rhodamnia argentea TaxID=178133 RepID=A0ABM3GU98_9MYRT|nr:uncharacterized protein LOC115756813 isoform X1 [Rhodamnia argentea]
MEKISAACAMDWSIELEKSLRSRMPGRAVEAILQVGQRLEQWSSEPEPTMSVYSMYGLVPGEERLFANTILLRLADAFLSGDGEIKRAVVRVFRRLRRCSRKRSGDVVLGILSKGRVNNPTELLTRMKVVFDGEDVESRAMALVMFGCCADFAKDSAHVRYLILSSLVSSEILEVQASLFAGGCFCELADDFALVFLQMLANLMSSPDTSSTVRLAGARIFPKMNCSCLIADGAYKTGLKMLLGSVDEEFLAAMMVSLSKLACTSPLLVSEQVDLLFSILSEGKTLFMQEMALRCIHYVYRRGVLHFPDAGNVKKLLRIADDPIHPTGLQCQVLRILCQVRFYVLPNMSPTDMLDFTKIFISIASQRPTKPKSILAICLLVDASLMVIVREEMRSVGYYSSLPLQVVRSIVDRILFLVRPSSNPSHSDSQVFGEVKIMLRLLLRLASGDLDLGALVLDQTGLVVKGLINECEGARSSEENGLSVDDGTEYMKEGNIVRISNLVLIICRFLTAFMGVLSEAGAITTQIFDKIKVLAECIQHCSLFTSYVRIICSLLLHSPFIWICTIKNNEVVDENLHATLCRYLVERECFSIECAGKILADKDYWPAYNAGFYAACQGAWFTANCIFTDLSARVKHKSHCCWLKSLAQFSVAEMKLQMLVLPDKGSSLTECLEKIKLPDVLIRGKFCKTGESAVESTYSSEFGEVVSDAYFDLQSSWKTLQSSATSDRAFLFQTWFMALRVKLLEIVVEMIKVSASISFDNDHGNNEGIERRGDESMKYLRELILISSRLMKLSKEFDLLAVSFVSIDRKSLQNISSLALGCSLLSFVTGFALFVPSLSPNESLASGLEDSKKITPTAILQNLSGRLFHLNHETAKSILSLLAVIEQPKSCFHLQSNNQLSGCEVRELLSICHCAVSGVIDLQNQTDGVREESLSEITKVSGGLAMNVVMNWFQIPIRAPKYYFKVRPPIGAELYVFNADPRHPDGLCISRGFQLSLNLCLQLKNMPPDLPVRQLYCIIHCREPIGLLQGPSGSCAEAASMVYQPWGREDMVDLNEKLFHEVMGCEEKCGAKNVRGDGATAYVHFKLNKKGQGFSDCLLDVSHFPVGRYRLKWHGGCLDDWDSYWSLPPLNLGPVFTVQ